MFQFFLLTFVFVSTTIHGSECELTDGYWADEFDSPEEFERNWLLSGIDSTDIWDSNENQTYLRENVKLELGNLHLISRQNKTRGLYYKFTSARVISRKSFLYGLFEIRAKLPRGRGSWPAISLMPDRSSPKWPDDGAIDIMQHVGFNFNEIYASVTCKAYNYILGNQKNTSVRVESPGLSLHTYKLEWTSAHIKIYVDGNQYFEYLKPVNSSFEVWPFDNPYRLVISSAVGGSWGGAKGIDIFMFPQRFIVDYVRRTEPNVKSVKLEPGSWKMGCLFVGNTFRTLKLSASECALKCRRMHYECTHYSWSKMAGGTCWLKKWQEPERFSAQLTSDVNMVCGVI